MSKIIKINGKILYRYNEILTDEALQLIKEIHEKQGILYVKKGIP